jgi:hypothetical protein
MDGIMSQLNLDHRDQQGGFRAPTGQLMMEWNRFR